MPKVSIIIPCYNAEKFIDRCLESVVSQTFHDIEIILIDDGSTDGTMNKCNKWAENDIRIRFISQKNSGAYAARNYGINLARADYIMFVDADDYIDKTMAEKMYASVADYDCDMSFCGVCEMFTNKPNAYINDKNILKGPANVFESKSMFVDVFPVLCNKIIKKSLIIENDLFFPEGRASIDQYFSRVVMLNSKKINQVSEVLYYYDHVNEKSITENPYVINYSIEAFEFLIDYMKENDIFDLFFDEMIGIVSRRLRGAINRLQFHKDKCFENEINKAEDFYCDTFNFDMAIKKTKVGIFGSYNSKAALQTLQVNFKNISFHYMNSSIISIMSEAKNILDKNDIHNINGFRKQCVYNDINKTFIAKLGVDKPDYILLDFLEDRFDILNSSAGIITESQAYLTSEVKDVDVYGKMCFGSQKQIEKWKESCIEFISFLKEYYPENKIILNEVYLSCMYGTEKDKTPFENCDELKKKNEILSLYYEFVKSSFKDIKVIRVDDRLEFCYIGHLYGVAPEHQNSMAYIQTAKLLHNAIVK